MNEIGSEFWKLNVENTIENDNLTYFENIGKDIKYLMSGRTAIDYILNNLVDKKKIAYMPEYCCNSMVQPFINNGYNVKYYKVDLINNKYFIDKSQDCSIFFGMSYFGYNNSNMDEYIKYFKSRNIVVIEDITHRIFCKENHCNLSDYLIASLRKWFPIYTGAIAISKNCIFNNEIDRYVVNTDMIRYKKEAMELKRDYIYGENINKNKFLDLFKKSNELIADYKNKKMDNESIEILKSINIQESFNKRVNNAKTIEERLENINKIKLIYKYQEGDCPLFVPIILNNRDDVRKKLINDNIYCPIHWTKFNNSSNELYEKELSLICDQRYNEKNINEYIQKLIKILEE